MPTAMHDRAVEDVPAKIRNDLGRALATYYEACEGVDGEALQSALLRYRISSGLRVSALVFVGPSGDHVDQLLGDLSAVVETYLDHYSEWQALKAKYEHHGQ